MIFADEYDNYLELHINDKDKVSLDKQAAEHMIDILIHAIPKKERRRKMRQIAKYSIQADKLIRQLKKAEDL